jgi:hypothetical protein
MTNLAMQTTGRHPRRDFETEWQLMRGEHDQGAIELPPNAPVRAAITAHFRALSTDRHYGVYVIRQKPGSRVLYVGKAGTVANDGTFKDQDLPRRLTNTRGTTSSARWFEQLLNQHGALLVEYVLLRPSPLSPAFAEAKLLQAFLNEFGRLPVANACL